MILITETEVARPISIITYF